jgi:hypothetical protein
MPGVELTEDKVDLRSSSWHGAQWEMGWSSV